MESVFEAAMPLSALLDRVAAGETITITRHGNPVATLAPVIARKKRSHAELVEALRELRTRVKPDTMSVREMVLHGRR